MIGITSCPQHTHPYCWMCKDASAIRSQSDALAAALEDIEALTLVVAQKEGGTLYGFIHRKAMAALAQYRGKK